ncbi:hypothetical protein C366_01048 [Cryptococcus neoformans Tu401-1]|nr:hypothetical protein C366_01048 [Cryptococcus neoformans var. grubii Tu401-1]OXM81188.1 hypothetical protein C364_01051 [Cryptococcus neoformans var. grubii Bt63]
MSTRFIIPPSPSPLPAAPPLSLLPFSLGPQHAPYTDKHANTSHYFQPRPLVADPGAAQQQQQQQQQLVQATFRGRLLVGQYLSVPPAYRGIILSTSLPPNKGGSEDHTRSFPISSSAPLTPLTSASASTSTDSAVEDDAVIDHGGGGSDVRRSQRKSVLARIKGAGQIALAQPRTRRTAPAKKRTRLDSDDEHDHESPSPSPSTSTPSKRVKSGTPATTPKRTVSVPEIVIQEPTPLKRPPPPPATTEEERQEGDGASVEVHEVKEPFIPSPETENDPPAFNITPPPYTLVNEEEEEEHEQEHEQQNDDGPVRILCPTAEFQGFMLYTGDVPLMGFRAEELEKERVREERVREEEAGRDVPESGCGSNINLRPSWWRHGGAGEGGDEFVRGMGEWLGLVEVLNKPVYLEGLDDDDDDDDE